MSTTELRRRPPTTYEIDATIRYSSMAVVLAGGHGKNLFPLTLERSIAAVPVAAKYRLIDIALSNCLNSGLRDIFILTQYNSASLNRHVSDSYAMDDFTVGSIDVLAAQQTSDNPGWYQGTADAVRQNMATFDELQRKYYFILSGDHLYRMNFRALLAQHMRKQSRVTIATTLVTKEATSGVGVVKTDAEGRVVRLVEKPDNNMLADLGCDAAGNAEKRYEANMGIYLFDEEVLREALNAGGTDFAKNILPTCLSKYSVDTFRFEGYWQDLGTIASFYKANLDLCETVPAYDYFDAQEPLFTQRNFLPATKINDACIQHALIADGCVLSNVKIHHCVLGHRTKVETGTSIERSIIMGAEDFDGDIPMGDLPPMGIGRDCKIVGAIIDKNVRIGNNVQIRSKTGMPDFDAPDGSYYVRDGITILPKGVQIPDGTII